MGLIIFLDKNVNFFSPITKIANLSIGFDIFQLFYMI